MKIKLKLFSLNLLYIILVGCASSYQSLYMQSAPQDYSPTNSVDVFQYNNGDINKIYKLIYNDFLIIGQASFGGAYEDPKRASEFAKSIGADVLITTSKFQAKENYFTTETFLSPYDGFIYTYKVPHDIDIYGQNGYFLKNINHIKPLWEKNIYDFKNIQNAKYSVYKNTTYTLDVYDTSTQKIAFINNVSNNSNKKWEKGDLKFIFNIKTKDGIYMLDNKQPMIAIYNINKFKYIEIHIELENRILLFEKINK